MLQPNDSGADGDAVSAERSANSECFLALYIPFRSLKMRAEREVQPMVLDISDGLLNKMVLNRSGPFTGTGPPLGTRL